MSELGQAIVAVLVIIAVSALLWHAGVFLMGLS